MKKTILLTLFSFLPALVCAQTPTPAPLATPAKMAAAPATPPPPPPRREGTAEFAFVGTSGNTSTQTMGLGGSFTFRPDHWVVVNRAAFVRNESDSVLTAESFAYLFRAERYLSERLAAFGEYAYFSDEFAGVDHRNSVMGGLSYKVIDTARQLFFVDGGLGYLDEQRTVPPDLSTATYAMGAGYRLKVSQTAEFSDDFRFTGTFDDSSDWRIYQNAALTARLTTLLSLRVGLTVRYAHEPVVGFESTDTTTSVALVAKF